MSQDEKIDFGALDPSRDAARWEGMVDAVARRALARRRASVARQLVAWSRPALAAAAALAMAAWVLAFVRPLRATPTPARPASALSTWAWNDELPATATILQVLGGSDDTR